MRSHTLIAMTATVGLLSALLPSAHAGQEATQKETQRETTRVQQVRSDAPEPKTATVTPTAATVPVYKPPLRGAPNGRLGGGYRGADGVMLAVLAPDHAGLTISEQPSVYWAISRATANPVELTVIDSRTDEPLVETQLPGPFEPGVHRIRLADHGVRLAPDVAYCWFVAIVRDPDHRAKDILAGGIIERSGAPDGFGARVARADGAELPSLYAGAGFWYDAVAALSELIEAQPDNAAFRGQRAALLRQVGLGKVAELVEAP